MRMFLLWQMGNSRLVLIAPRRIGPHATHSNDASSEIFYVRSIFTDGSGSTIGRRSFVFLVGKRVTRWYTCLMKQFLLAYDQGFEHGPVDFDDTNVDPQQIIDIANKAGVFTGIIFQEGIAEKYPVQIPLILKLNGHTKLHPDEDPYSPQLCTVQKAIELGAVGVGYTIFVGSVHEAKMMQEFSLIEDEAHKNNLQVIAWMYPRGKSVKNLETSRDIVAYAARLGLELGADLVKVPYTGDVESFSWVVKSAGKTGVLAQGGAKINEDLLLKEATEIMQSGAAGMAVGRNIWQSSDPINLSKKLADIIFKN